MPVQIIGKYDFENVMLAKPDLRFATTFLSNKYRAYSVAGESMQDKVTGEIFTKRPEDGRVVSFFQNKKYMHDLMLELKILINSDPAFTYPEESKEDAFYLSTDYDIMQIFDETEHNIVNDDTIIPNDDEVDYHNLVFALSTYCNGFFVRPTSRDSDKVIINWLTNKYDNIIKNYSGNDPVYLAEKAKFDEIEDWDSSNAVINYTVITTNTETGQVSYITSENCIHINEEHCVFFPINTLEAYDVVGPYKVQVRINSLKYDKFHFIIDHLEELGLLEEYNKFIYPDKKILMQYLNIESFVDNSEDIIFNENEFLVAMVDVPFTYRYMRKISKINEYSTSIIISTERPSDVVWVEGTIWAEDVRNVFGGGRVIDSHSETSIKDLERYLSNMTDERSFPYFDVEVNPYRLYKKLEYFDIDNTYITTDELDETVFLIDKNNLYLFNKKETDAFIPEIIPINEGGEE